MQPFGRPARPRLRRELLAEGGRITRKIERFIGNDGSSLVIGVILARNAGRQPGQNHFRTRKADQAYDLPQDRAMVPALERAQYVLRGNIRSVQEPDVHDSERGERPASLDLALGSQRSALLVADCAAAAIPASCIDHCDTTVLVEDRARQVTTNVPAFIIGVCDDQEDVRLVTVIRVGQRRSYLRPYRNQRVEATDCGDQYPFHHGRTA